VPSADQVFGSSSTSGAGGEHSHADHEHPLYNAEGDDEDCKYHVKLSSTDIYKDEDVTFTVVTGQAYKDLDHDDGFHQDDYIDAAVQLPPVHDDTAHVDTPHTDTRTRISRGPGSGSARSPAAPPW